VVFEFDIPFLFFRRVKGEIIEGALAGGQTWHICHLRETEGSMSAKFKIVSLCGSAGALSAYIAFLKAMPVDSGMTFVVLTHRRIDTPCWLVEIFSRITTMPVEEIVDGSTFEPNRIYVIPAGQDLTIDGDAFRLVPARTVWGWPDGFDIYLESVARTTNRRALTVILSGLATDGSAFLRKLRQSGGLNYAQNDAPTPEMPNSAIQTGMIDYAGSSEQIAAVILGRLAGNELLSLL
jgi:chemotaxis response regulator CheB